MADARMAVRQNMREAARAVAKQRHALLSFALFPRFSQAALAEQKAWSRLYYEGDLSPQVFLDFERMRPQRSVWWTFGWQNPGLVLLYSAALLYASSRARAGVVFKACAAGAPWLFFRWWKSGDIARVLDFAEYSTAIAEGKLLKNALMEEISSFERAEFARLFPGKTVAQALAEHHQACLAAEKAVAAG